MKTILGLDLGSNSIGWALIELNSKQREGKILGTGSRIIPMDAATLGDFEKGNTVSATAITRGFRSARRLYERDTLRRERLHRVLNMLGFLPEHYSEEIDFEKRLGQFKKDKEPKLPYKKVSQRKFEFLFKESFDEMVEDFKVNQPQLFYIKSNGEEARIPYDWTIYYLRKKALTQKIEKEELAWILLNFNQKRGYYQLRGEENDEDDNKDTSFEVVQVGEIVDSGDKIKKTGQVLYDIYFKNGWKYDKQITRRDDWVNKTKEFIVTTSKLASGEIKRTFKSVDSEKDWIAIKQKAEQDINTSGKTVGEYIYDTLLKKPNQKIRGKLVRTIERKFYKKELLEILETQKEFHSELKDRDLYIASIEELYPHNEPHRNNIANRDFLYLFVDDIIFYHRPLKSKKYLIDECPLEIRGYESEDGTKKKKGVKCIAKSNPLFQELRILQWMKNLKIYRKDENQEVDVTAELLSTITERELLFEWLNDRSEIDQKAFLRYKRFDLEQKIKEMLDSEEFSIYKKDKEQGLHTYYRWNYVEDKKYPLNETRGGILAFLKKAGIDSDFLNSDTEMHLWHILYSVEDRNEIELALRTFAMKHALPESFIDIFKKYPRINKEYGSYSAKAIKKLLPLMRFGKWWSWDAIEEKTLTRIDKLISGEYDEKIKNQVREKAINLNTEEDFQDLPLWLTSYIVYNRHSEASTINYWKEAHDITLLKQHSLRNPIVEIVVNETLQTVKEIWELYGEGKENFFNKIHIELGRDLKSTKDQRKTASDRIAENEKTNSRAKALLIELFNDGDVENVRPYSPMQQNMLKIYEEGIYLNPDTVYSLVSESEIDTIRRKNTPTPSDLKRYKLWLEQGYKSPYTGENISLSKLFTPAYEIEHIIPQTRFFDDGFSNKVICEAEVNTLKGNQLAFEFINNNKELKIELSYGKIVTLLHPDVYEKNVKHYFGKNRAKMNRLLMEEIPDSFINRQLNDTRYISKIITSLLSNIVREEGEEESISKNVIPTTGRVTAQLKRDWGLNDVWNEIITPRFERLNKIAGYEKYGSWENKEGKRVFQINTMESELSKLDKKRIDHRHHALDALVVACSTRNHINYLNNMNANGKDKSKPLRYDLREKLRRTEEIEVEKAINGEVVRIKMRVAKEFYKPWDTFTQDAKDHLNKIIVSFKKNNRVINKTVNHYQNWEKQLDGTMKKVYKKQVKGDHWAIRKPLHVLQPYSLKSYNFDHLPIADNVGKIELIIDDYIKDQVKKAYIVNNRNIGNTTKYLKKNPIVDKDGKKVFKTDFRIDCRKFRKRKPILDLSNRGSQGGIKTLEQMVKLLNKIYNRKLKEDLFEHLKIHGNDIDIAFSTDGIEKFNSNRDVPVYRLPIAEDGDKRFRLGDTIGSNHKWVEAEAGTNLFFAIYVNDKGIRNYETIPLNIVIESQKQGMSSCPDTNVHGDRLLFFLSPNDLVYVPTHEEQDNPHAVDFCNISKEQVKRIYKFVSCTSGEGHFIPNFNACEIVKNENGTNSKHERIQDFFDNSTMLDENEKPVQIKSICWKLEIDRLGNIKKVFKYD